MKVRGLRSKVPGIIDDAFDRKVLDEVFGPLRTPVVVNEEENSAEWWANECGGVLCSNCGLFHDDYYEPAPSICPRCNSKMDANVNRMIVDKENRLSCIFDDHYADESEYPDWLLKLRKGDKK